MRRRTLQFYILLFLAMCAGCSRQVRSDKVVIPPTSTPPAESAERWFRQVKSSYTVVLKTQKMSNQPRLMNPLGGGRGTGMDHSFPMMVEATMMDEEVVEAGLRYYAEATSMSADEFDSFAKRYRELHEPDDYILIEASLRTSLAESYLDLERYTVFLEDERMNQYLPAKMIEMPMATNRSSELFDQPLESQRPLFMDVTSHRKELFIYFPRVDFYGNPMIHEGLEYLKLVFLLEVDGSARAEGMWVFNPE